MQISATRHSLGVSTGRTAGLNSSSPDSDLNRDTSRARVSGSGAGSEAAAGVSATGASAAGISAAEVPARTKTDWGRPESAAATSTTDLAAGATAGGSDGSDARVGTSATGAGATAGGSEGSEAAVGTAATATGADAAAGGSDGAEPAAGTSATATAAGSDNSRWGVAPAAAETLAVGGDASTGPTSVPNDDASRGAARSSIPVAVFSMSDKWKLMSLAASQPARATVPDNVANATNCRGFIARSPPLRAASSARRTTGT